MNLDHLNSLQLLLSKERSRHSIAKTDAERNLRKVWVSQLEKEVALECKFLGIEQQKEINLSDDDLLDAIFN